MFGTRLFQCACLSILLADLIPAQNVITTLAGSDATFAGSGQRAANVPLGYVNGVATDGAGNVYFTNPLEHLVLRVSPAGTLTVIAGNGIADYSGDGGPAVEAAIAAFDSPEQYVGPQFPVSLGGIVVDKLGNVYFADGSYVRKVTTDGTITTVAGGGTQVPGDGGPATQASLGNVSGVALDTSGNLYFCERNRVRKMTADGTLTTYAGATANGFSGDGQAAVAALLSLPQGLAFDAQGNLFVTDGDVFNFPGRIRKITLDGKINTVAGGGTKAPADGAVPLSLDLSFASGLAVDATGAVYVYAPGIGRLMKLSGPGGMLTNTTLITSPVPAAFTTNVPARTAYLVGRRVTDNSGIALDASGNLYVGDSRDRRLCKIDAQGNLTTLAGNGAYSYGGDGGSALGALIQGPTAMTQTPDGTIYFADSLNARVRAISPAGIITTALSADNFPDLGILEIINGVASDQNGNVYVLLAHRVLQLTPGGGIQVIVNQSGIAVDSSDGGPAAQATLQSTGSLAVDGAGNLYVSDPGANRIRKVTLDQRIHAVAGTGDLGFSPDGALAVSSPISFPTALLADSQGGLYFEEAPPPPTAFGTAVLRYITPDGHLKTIAGNGIARAGFTGDGGAATRAGLMMQVRTGLALDKSGSLYIADGFNNRVRVVTNGIISTFAGNGDHASTGDGGAAKNAGLVIPRGLLFDAKGDLLISDVAANRIRIVLATPPAIAVSPAQMNFSGKAGGAPAAPKQLVISSPLSGLAFSVTKATQADWLLVGVAGGATPQLIDVRADPSNLAPGSYQATLTVSSPLANPANTSISITFQVNPGTDPKLSVDETALSFTFPSRPSTTATQQVRVSNTGTGSLVFSARIQTATGGDWLSVDPASGSASPKSPVRIAVTANPRGLAAGTYTGTITITSVTTGESATVTVTLTVSVLDQAIRLSHGALSFTAVANGGVVPPGSFAVSNIGRGSMNFSVSTRTLSGGQQWLSATPVSGTAVAGGTAPNITVAVNQAGLAPGFHYGLVQVDSAGSANTPQVVTIVVRVLAADQDPGPVIVPTEVVIKAVQGGPSPGSLELSVYNISSTPQTYFSSAVTGDPSNRFDLLPRSTTLTLTQPTRLIVQPITSGLAAGVHNAELTLQFSDGNIRRVGIRTIVTPGPAGTSSTAPDGGSSLAADRATTGCTPTQLVPAITTLGQSFGVPAAWPVALAAEIRDDCGNTLDTGNVTVSFSNGDPPLSLQSLQSGLWNATWQSGRNSGPVTLTMTATDPARNLAGTREVTGGLGDSAPAPVLGAAVSGASFAASAPLAPGSIISLFGQALANGNAAASLLPLGSTLAGATVVMAGNALPLIYGSNGQINAVVSAGINVNTSHQILVQRDNTLSVPIQVGVAAAEPAIFGYPASGDPTSQGAIVNAVTYAVAHPGTPVTAGDVIAIFCTGLGPVDRTVPDGAAAPGPPLANTTTTPIVMIGGKTAAVSFSGLSPGFVGLYQIDAIVPAGVAPGNQVPVVLSIAGQTSPAATIAVK